jgi:Sec-independent protein translocase protein TatA
MHKRVNQFPTQIVKTRRFTEKKPKGDSMNKKIYILTGLLALVFGMSQAIKAQEDVGRLLQELENNSDRFAKSFDNAADNSDLNGTSTEGEATRYVHEFEDSIDRLKAAYDKNKEAKIAAQDVVTRAKLINKVMNKYKMDEASQTDWKSVKVTLERLAAAYSVKLKWDK